MRSWFVIVPICCLAVWSASIPAQSLKDLLKDAVDDYVEKKSEELGLDSQDSDGDGNPDHQNNPIQKVTLVFTGITLDGPDVFQALHTNSTPSLSAPSSKTSAEQVCYSLVQDKIAWNYQGTNHWTDSSVNNLCKGTTQGTQPPDCFSRAMFNGNQWGKKATHTMTWILASQLCSGTDNATEKIACLKQNIGQNKALEDAVSTCGSGTTPYVLNPVLTYKPAVMAAPLGTLVSSNAKAEQECYQYVQGNIAWDAAGKSKNWNPENVKRLCKGTTAKFSPGNCFKYVISNPAAWGKKPTDSIDWNGAIDLCEGTSNANQSTSCFKNAIGSGKTVTQAIRQCEV